MSCEFCENADFGCFRAQADAGGAHISLAGGCSRFPKEEQFAYCPMCGEPLTEPEPLTLEELMEMDGEPVWVLPGNRSIGEWVIVNTQDNCLVAKDSGVYRLDRFGVPNRGAYRRPPKGART